MVRYGVTPDPGARPRRDEIRMREVDRSNRRAFDALAGSNSVARHTWYGSGNIVANADVTLDKAGHWTAARDGGIARFQPATDFDVAGFYLGRPGRWAINLYVASDMTEAGLMRTALVQATPGDIWDGQGYLTVTQARHSGYSQAGSIDNVLSWVGPVFEAEASAPIGVVLRNITGGTLLAACKWRLQLSFLGDMTVAEQQVIAPVATVPQDDAAAGTTASG